jgi:hypothetical protein
LTLEKDSNAPIAMAVKRLGGRLIRVHTTVKIGRIPRRLADPGTPDRVALFPGGLTLWVEQKRPGGVLSPDQIAWHEWAERCGHRVAVVESAADVIWAVNAARKSE